MSLTIDEIESEITKLPQHDLQQLASWFEEFYESAWDKHIEDDFDAGRLNGLIKGSEEEYKTRMFSALPGNVD